MGALLGRRGLHQEHQWDEHQGEHGEQPEGVKVGERGGLLLAEVLEDLQGHLLDAGRVAGLLQEGGLALFGECLDGRVERVEELSDAWRCGIARGAPRWFGRARCRRCRPRFEEGQTSRQRLRADAAACI